MSQLSNESWITTLITATCNKHLLVDAAVSTQLQELLNSQFTADQLTEVQLRKVAKGLLELLVNAAPKGEGK